MHINWKPIAEILQGKHNFVLTTHMSPDGDGLGSEIALYHLLTDMGKSVRIFNPSLTPGEYAFLDPDEVVEKYDPALHKPVVDNADVFIVLDIGDYSRLQDLGTDIQTSAGITVCIDHHPQNKHEFDYEAVDIDTAATGMMVFELIKSMAPDAINFEIAQGLYCALMTDTGSFRFSNTTPFAHQMAKELLEYGVDPPTVYSNVYESSSIERMRLLGLIIERLQFAADGKIVYFPVTLKMQEKAGTTHQDVDGFSDFIRSLGDIEVAVMFHELNPERTRINFRSKGRVIINTVAKKFGGGGHMYAAGAIIEKPYPKVIPEVISATEQVLHQLNTDKKSRKMKQTVS